MAIGNTAQIQITASTSRLPAALRSAMRMIGAFGSGVGSILGAGMSKQGPWTGVADIGRRAMGHVVGSLATRGLDTAIDQGKAIFEFNDDLVRFGIAARKTPDQLEAIGAAARSSAADIGIDAREVLRAGRAYIDLAGAEHFTIGKMNLLAKAAQATGSSTKDLAGMMYQLTLGMKVSDAQMEDTIGGLINQAKDGAIEAKQMAAEFSGMVPIFARFGKVGREGAIELGAMYQVTRNGFDSAAQAATGMIRLMAGFQRHASRFKKWDINVFKPGSKKELREIGAIMEDVKKNKLSKDIEALIKSFGRSEAWRTFELLAEAPNQIKKLVEAGRANNVVMQDLGTYSESSMGRMKIAMERMKNTIAETFTPERIEGFVQAIEALTQKIQPLMDGLGKIGDILGGVYGIGRSLRGAIDPNASSNPFKKKYVMGVQVSGPVTDAQDTRVRGYDRNNKPILSPESKRIQNEQSWEAKASELLAAEDGGKMTARSVELAVIASRKTGYRPGEMGEIDAGMAYLGAAGISKDRQNEIYAKAMADAMKPIFDKLGPVIAAAMGKTSISTQVKVDGNPIAKASSNATDKRRR